MQRLFWPKRLYLDLRSTAQSERNLRLRPFPVRYLSSAVCLAFSLCLLSACSWGGSPGSASGSRTPMAIEEFDYEGYLKILQEASGIDDPPETEIIRVIVPEEQPEVWQACMTEAGFVVSTTPDGGLAPPQDLPDEQRAAYSVADYVCHAKYPVDAAMFRSFGEEQIRATFDYYVDVLTPCLEEHGITVGPPSSWATFRSSWISDGRGGFHASEATWFPYTWVDAEAVSDEQWEELNRECPQPPPTDLLFSDG